MIYQLKCGRILYLSIEEYLALSDEELELQTSITFGEEVSPRMYYGEHSVSVHSGPEVENDLDYIFDSEEPGVSGRINLNLLPEDIEPLQ